MARTATHQLLQFARWAVDNPEGAADVELIRETFLVNRRTACRWRRAWRAAGRMVLPCDVGSRRGPRPTVIVEPDAEVMDYVRAACGVGRHG